MIAHLRTTLLALLAVVAVSSSASAAVLCGATVTADVALQSDAACASTGIIVGTDGITIDLGGFTLSGDGVAGHVGIDVNSHSGVTIKNGTVKSFDIGVKLALGAGSIPVKLKLADLTLRDNATKGAMLKVANFSITNCVFLHNGDFGLDLTSGRGTVSASMFVDNASEGAVVATEDLKITKVIATGNGDTGLAVSDTIRVAITSSTFAGNGGAGLSLDNFDASKVTGNTSIGNTKEGIFVASSLHVATDGGPNVISGNLVAGNGMDGIHLLDPSQDTQITKNRAIGNAGNGIFVDFDPQATLVQGNTAIGNVGAGIATNEASTTVTKNVSNGNGSGFSAPNGAVDGGGNTARANAGFFDPCSAAIACPPTFVSKPGSTTITPTCNMHVSSSITLGADTPICAGTSGIVVDTGGITINLNGHRLQGDRAPGVFGVDVAGNANVTIENGVIRGFGTGVRAFGAGTKLVNVEVRDNVADGAALDGTGTETISKSIFAGNGATGVTVGADAIPKVSASFFVGNTTDGLASSAAGGSFAGVTATLNHGSGVTLAAASAGSSVQKALLARNTGAGVFLQTSSTGTVAGSTIIGNADGISSISAGTLTFSGNVIGGNTFDGIEVAGPSHPNTVKSNTLIGNANDGASVTLTASATTVEKNLAIGNRRDGLVSGSPATFAKNTADGNLAIGIDASQGTDGGGNRAAGNAGSAQCLGPLACK
ncbi:MAG TPA: right-handed parallel beta-helix repeat-containing protein [Candidatus Binatia bacterium]|jgi:parallel beta-helix repeat protein